MSASAMKVSTPLYFRRLFMLQTSESQMEEYLHFTVRG